MTLRQQWELNPVLDRRITCWEEALIAGKLA